MDKTTIKNEQLIDAAKSLPIVAEREGWVLTLDKEEGTLFYSPEKISDQAQLHQITDEYALYLDKDFKPQGMMIECYEQNFLKHHDSFIEELSEDVFKGKKEGETIVADPEGDKGKGKISTLAKFLESTLIKEAGAKLG